MYPPLRTLSIVFESIVHVIWPFQFHSGDSSTAVTSAVGCVALAPRPWMLYAAGVLLSGLCVLQLIYPLAKLLAIQPVSLRFVLASLMTFSPIFFANLIFSMTLRDRPLAEHLFGWNLLGAFCGGLLEYTSMAIGYNWLSCLVLISYSFVFVLIVIEKKQQQTLSALPVASHTLRQ